MSSPWQRSWRQPSSRTSIRRCASSRACEPRPAPATAVDWEWSGPFDVMHDIAKLVLLSELNDAEGEAQVLRLYYGAEAVTPLHHARIRLWLLHTVSREALWCHAAASNPADDDFDYAGEAKRFAREFVDRLATEETALLMAEVAAALATL